MLHQDAGLSLEVVWLDSDVVEVRVRGRSPHFGAEAQIYSAPREFGELAACFEGFPDGQDDERSFELGSWDPELAGGGIRLHLSTVDRLGHGILYLQLRTDPRTHPSTSAGRPESAEFAISIEPAGVDQFVKHLAAFGPREGDFARLPGAIP